MSKKIEENLWEEFAPVVSELGYDLADVEFVKEGRDWILRFYIDEENGISADDCETVSRVLSPALDELDPIAQSYLLEVSSPDLSRPLEKDRDFQRNLGRELEFSLYQKVQGKKDFSGKLLDWNEKELVVAVNGEELTVARKNISLCRQKVTF